MAEKYIPKKNLNTTDQLVLKERKAKAKAEAEKKMSKGLKPMPKKNGAESIGKPAPRATQKADKNKASLIQEITNRYRVTAREARDIVTAVGSIGKAKDIISTEGKKRVFKEGVKNLKTQVAETAVAAATGKKGTESNQVKKLANGTGIFTGESRDKSKNAPGYSVEKTVKELQKQYNKKKAK